MTLRVDRVQKDQGWRDLPIPDPVWIKVDGEDFQDTEVDIEYRKLVQFKVVPLTSEHAARLFCELVFDEPFVFDCALSTRMFSDWTLYYLKGQEMLRDANDTMMFEIAKKVILGWKGVYFSRENEKGVFEAPCDDDTFLALISCLPKLMVAVVKAADKLGKVEDMKKSGRISFDN